MEQISKTISKEVCINIPIELNKEIELMIQEEPKYASKSQFVETAVRMFLRRIEESKELL